MNLTLKENFATINNKTTFAAKKVTSLNSWISEMEFNKFLRVAMWATTEVKFNKEYKLIITRIRKLIKTNGFNYTFKYLKECLRLVTLYLAGTPSTTKGRKAIGVRVNQYGLPVIIPSPLRAELNLSEGSRITTRTILTVLSIFRVFPTKVKPDLGSILQPFDGVTRTLLGIGPVGKKLLKEFKYKLSFGPIEGFISESSGPIAKKATWGSWIDAIALLNWPHVAFGVLNRLVAEKALAYIISLFALWIILGIPYLLLVVFGLINVLPIGRLSVVYDQAGKARIVAMVNWWIQLVLLPLHNSIFGLLKEIPQDGTFNQDKPLRRLMSAPLEGHRFSCFDLSSATDRLPIDLQIQLLNSLGINGRIWQTLLTFPYTFKGQDVVYSVGQPMGAYSSWAMLALTHHCIVKLAADRAGECNFTNYCLLGDDIVINHDKVANEYLGLMKALGVGINMSKSIVSNQLCEFAKLLVTPQGEISPIGAGSLLLVTRKDSNIGSLLVEMHLKSYLTNSNAVYNYIKSFSSITKVKKHWNFSVLWTYLGICNHYYSAHTEGSFERTVNTNSSGFHIFNGLGEELYSCLRMHLYNPVIDTIRECKAEEAFFWKNFYKLRANRRMSNGLLNTLGIFLSPGLYLYGLAFLRATERSKISAREYLNLDWNPKAPEQVLKYSNFPGISVRGWNRRQSRKYGQFVIKLAREYDELMSRSRSRY